MILDSTARDLGTTGRDDIYGYGIVDAANAIIGMIPPVPAFPPSIINSSPTSPVNTIAGETRTFNITTDQTVSVEWFINCSHVQTDTSVTFAQYTNTSAFPGNWNVTARASNVNGTTMFSWVWNVTSVPIPVPASPPKIINSFPTSPVNNVAGESRKFNITVDQIVNVTWYINNTPVQYDESITYAQYTNISASSGIWNVTAIASNINGGVMRSWTWNVTPIPPPKPGIPPSITSYEPSSPVKDIAGASRAFKIKIDQIVNVTWYINGTPVQSDGGVKEARYTNISASSGIWNVTAIASNINGGVMRSWTWNVTPIPPPKPGIPPSITSYEPSSPVKDIAGASRAFKIKIDQIVNVTWYINGTPVQSDGGVKEARYTNISASSGIWNVTAIASNINGGVMRSWTWNVTPIPPPKPGIPPSITSYEPSSPVKDIAGASRAFKIKIDQIVNVTWYINGTPVQSDGGVKEARYTNISASSGIWNVTAIASNINGGVMRSWTWNVTPIPPPKPGVPPSITSYEPSSPVKDIAGASRAFKIKIDQIVNVTWYINGTPVQSDGGVKEARYTNISALPGTWNVSAIATNVNGNVMRSWTWNVTPIPPPKPALPPSITSYEPSSPVKDIAGASRAFKIKIDQIVSVTWYLNGTPVQSDGGV